MSEETTVVTRKTIHDVRFDPKNARVHSPKNVGMIGTSLQETGAGRSILLANDGTVLAGNATVEAALASGITEIIEVETTGHQLVAVKRTDLDAASPKAVLAGLYDNRSAELASWSHQRLRDVRDDPAIDLDPLWDAEDLDALLDDAPVILDYEPPASTYKGFRTLYFSFTHAQAALIESAIQSYVAAGLADATDNPHKPSNAVHALIERASLGG